MARVPPAERDAVRYDDKASLRHAMLDGIKLDRDFALFDQRVPVDVAVLAGVPPQLRSSCNIEAIRADGTDTLGAGGQFFRRLIRPTPWLRAPRGLLNQVPGLYPDAVAAQLCTDVPALRDLRVDDVNHYTITMSEHGARVVADVIRTQM